MVIKQIFGTVIQMTLVASWATLIVIAARLMFNRAPKRIRPFLWILPALRSVMPYTLNSIFSFVPRKLVRTASQDNILTFPSEAAPAVLPSGNIPTAVLPETIIEDTSGSLPVSVFSWQNIAAYIWLAGMAAMIIYAVISLLYVQNRISKISKNGDEIIRSHEISSPFVFGFFRPVICLPTDIENEAVIYITLHEKTHILRGDNIFRLIGFIILSVHWFNPVMWLAYLLFIRDTELACDEEVIKGFSDTERANYSQVLLNISSSKKYGFLLKTSFGESGIKERVKKVLNYKKTPVWILVISIIVLALIAVCLLTNPNDTSESKNVQEIISEIPETTTEIIETKPPLTLIGKWEQLGEIENKSQFDKDRIINHNMFGSGLKTLYFMSKWNSYWIIEGWTEEVLYTSTGRGKNIPNDIEIERRDDGDYLFLTLDKNTTEQEAKKLGYEKIVLVYQKTSDKDYDITELIITDDLNIGFTDDQDLIGEWTAYEYLRGDKDNYSPSENKQDNLYIDSLNVYGQGNAILKCSDIEMGCMWSKGVIANHSMGVVYKYELRRIDGVDYLIMEWKNGDYIYTGEIAGYYVLVKK